MGERRAWGSRATGTETSEPCVSDWRRTVAVGSGATEASAEQISGFEVHEIRREINAVN